MINRILARFEAEKNREKPFSVTNILWDRAISIVQEVAKEYKAPIRCLTCARYTDADTIDNICYLCCKGIEDNYEQKGE